MGAAHGPPTGGLLTSVLLLNLTIPLDSHSPHESEKSPEKRLSAVVEQSQNSACAPARSPRPVGYCPWAGKQKKVQETSGHSSLASRAQRGPQEDQEVPTMGVHQESRWQSLGGAPLGP